MFGRRALAPSGLSIRWVANLLKRDEADLLALVQGHGYPVNDVDAPFPQELDAVFSQAEREHRAKLASRSPLDELHRRLEAFGGRFRVVRLPGLEPQQQLLELQVPGSDPVLICGDGYVRAHLELLKYGQGDLSILIQGETGVGKEMAARLVHAVSARHSGAFVTVNCGAIAEPVANSEFFGHERGAFTDAHERSVGLFHQADKGTLFLDEVAELSLQMQASLLRTLQSGESRRVGGMQPERLDVRVVAASNVNLRERVLQGRFRRDLYHRLDGANIWLPPLRESQGEILPLARYLLARSFKPMEAPEIRPCAARRLMMSGWPGNRRELAQLVKRVKTRLEFADLCVLLAEDLDVDDSEAGTVLPLGRKRGKQGKLNAKAMAALFELRRSNMNCSYQELADSLVAQGFPRVTGSAIGKALPDDLK